MGAVSSLRQGVASTAVSSEGVLGVAPISSRALHVRRPPLAKARRERPLATVPARARPAGRPSSFRAICRFALRGVNPPGTDALRLALARFRIFRQALASRTLTVCVGLIAAWAGLVLHAGTARAEERRIPLTGWFEGV